MVNVRKISYWTIQIIVWSLLTGVIAYAYWASGNELKLEFWQVVLDFSVVILLAIFFTHQLKRLLKKWVEFDNLKINDGFKILGLLIVAALFFCLTYVAYNKFMYTLVYMRPDVLDHPSQNLKKNSILFINYILYFIIWTVFYVAIKGLMELNKGRETRLQLESNLKESQLNTLKGQINPHFMFNSLNNIRGLMLEDVERARNMLTSLSETLRYSLTKSNVDSIALEDELEMVENYIEISRIQFENRLKYKAIIERATLNTQIPPMIIQMLVENAVKHGISNLKGGGEIILSTKIEDSKLVIEVSNSGKLTSSPNSTQLGLKNIEQRLHLLYGEAATFSLKEFEKNVVATIKIPTE